MKCDIIGCGKEMAPFDPIKPRLDGALFEDLSTKRAYSICTECRKRLGLIGS